MKVKFVKIFLKNFLKIHFFKKYLIYLKIEIKNLIKSKIIV